MVKVPKPCPPDCERRSVTCHVTCKDYADFVEYNEARRQKEHMQRASEGAIYEHVGRYVRERKKHYRK